MLNLGLVAILLFMQQPTPPAQAALTPKPHAPETTTTLMETTFLISGPSAKPSEENKTRYGTCFVMLRPVKQDSKLLQYVIVTAKHAFEDIKGEVATVSLRKRNAAGDVEIFPFPLKIRDKDKALYTVHPMADVAVIDVALPNDSTVVQLGPDITNINWLATDKFLGDIGIHPGDELLCLGYPLGLRANDAGYSILRSGKIASYPIIPFKKTQRVLYDFRVYPGNSGGPVYFSFANRPYRANLMLGTTYQKIFGLVTEKANPVGEIDPLIGIIVPSIFIKETIDILAGFESEIKED
jgi:hypothetical protein